MATLPETQVGMPEALLAVIGIRPVISHEVEKVYKSQLNEAAKLNKTIQKLARELVNDKLDDTFESDLDYEATLKDLARGWDIHQVEKMVAAFPAQYRAIGSAFVALSSSLVEELLQMYPVSTYETVTGSISQLPSDLKLWKFVNILEILDNPVSVFSLMAAGALLRNQAKAIRTVYPDLSQAIDVALLQATVSAKAKKKSFELEPMAEIGVKAWFGKSPLNPGLLRRLQDTHVKAKAAKAAAQKPTTGPGNAIDQTGSPSAQAEYGHVV